MSYQTETQTNQQQAESNDYSETLYKIPTKPYYLVQTIRPLEEICGVTYNLHQISEDFKSKLFFRIGNRNWPTTVGMYKAPRNIDALKMIIGENGHFLKLTTSHCDVDMIWHDRRNEMFLFWGPSIYTVVQAMNQIRSRIIKYTIYVTPFDRFMKTLQAAPEQALPVQASLDGVEDISDDEDEDEDYDDMPALIDCNGNIVN
jgi:hypothetical protein